MTCSGCGHHIKMHGDRAVFPACEGGYNGKTLPQYGVSNVRYASACACKGFEAHADH